MPTVLPEIVSHKLSEVAYRKARIPQTSLEDHLEPASGKFEPAMRGTLVKLITEVKPASPSAGILRTSLNLEPILESYNQYGAAISVLTDQKYFHGSMDLLSQVAQSTHKPVLCKDFILDVYQVMEARRAGADAVLLIVKILTDNQLRELYRDIENLGMTAVVEVQNETELDRALKLSPEVILINNRNLDTFEISLETTHRLAPLVPEDIHVISASGIENRADIEGLLPVCSRFLVGSALMRAKDVSAKLRELAGQ